MALHGQICVNHIQLGWWSARRLTDLQGVDAVHRYECEVVMVDVMGSLEPHHATFVLRHRFSDGAVVLASKVLTRASKHFGKENARDDGTS